MLVNPYDIPLPTTKVPQLSLTQIISFDWKQKVNSCTFWLWCVWHILTVSVRQTDRNLMAICQVKRLPLPTSHISSRSWKSYQDFQCWRYGASSKPLLLNLYPSLLSTISGTPLLQFSFTSSSSTHQPRPPPNAFVIQALWEMKSEN